MVVPVTFRWGIFVSSLVALLAVWGGHAQMSRAVYDRQLRESVSSAETAARAFERSTHRTLHEIDVTLHNLALRYGEQGVQGARRLIEQGLYDPNLIHHFAFFDSDGDLVFRNEGQDTVTCVADQPFFAFHKGVGQSLMYAGQPFAGSTTGQPLLRFSRRIESPDGGFAGVVVANADPDELSDVYSQALVGPRGSVILAGLDRMVRVQAGGAGRQAIGTVMPESPLWEAIGTAITGVVWQTDAADGRRRVYAYRTVQGYPLIVMVGVALEDIQAAVSGLHRHLLIIALLLTLSILTVAGFLLAQHRNARRLEEALAVNRDFLARVSHELRTPLNAILGFSEVIRDRLLGPRADGRYADYAADIHESGRHLLALIDDILDLSRLQAGRMTLQIEPVDLRSAVEWVMRIIAVQAEQKDIRLFCELPADLRTIRADDRAVKQMLLNLLHNAVKFTPRGGSIRVAAERQGGTCVLRIADTGIGMTPEQLRQAVIPLGQASAQTRQDGQGTGLGLSIVKSLMEAQGGRMHIDSRPGEGSQITLEFVG
ncbi:sensor histidine kinase [Azospirillum thermophilum]|uniref:histidine kinase n=1 Tax=Azospirillum thermophilum TaxID=2202148 RepID=A0A2S2CWM6_9PROT|nr:ATP-binding protein [Azospirillum thermophilum]AWK88891.1 two-component sensor histidine kinase [Azospirillum thermophilum]